jgi:hypothetical protein
MVKFFYTTQDKKKYDLLQKWNKIENRTEKRVISYDYSGTKYLKYEDHKDKVYLMLLEVFPYVTYRSEFVKTKQIAHIYFSKKTKKFYVLGNSSDLLRYIISIKRLKKFLNIDWDLNNEILKYHNKIILKKILLRELTNKNLFVECYLKHTWNIKKGDIKSNLIIQEFINKYSPGLNFLGKAMSVSDNAESTIREARVLNLLLTTKDTPLTKIQQSRLNKLRSEPNDILRETMAQAKILQKKINFSWSYKRLIQEHSKWSKEIAEIKAKYIKKEEIIYSQNYILPYGKLITSNVETYLEGNEMDHCLFSNGYWQYVKNRKALIIKYFNNGNRGTAFIKLHKFNVNDRQEFFPVIDQFYSYGNTEMDKKDWEVLRNSLNNELKQIALTELKQN